MLEVSSDTWKRTKALGSVRLSNLYTGAWTTQKSQYLRAGVSCSSAPTRKRPLFPVIQHSHFIQGEPMV